MKLQRIKLINWHIFSNITIDVDRNILITGENGCGKSTLMDAIYYVVSGGDNKQFNKAANQEGERTLETYLRGKIGSDKTPFLRKGSNVYGHIALEYKDEANIPLVLGTTLEIIDNQPVRSHFYVIDKYTISDIDYIVDNKAVDYKTLKSRIKSRTSLDVKTLDDSRIRRRTTIGRDIYKIKNHQRFFELLKNAISFKPITEVSTFVNGFLLKEDVINLDSLKEEIRSYQEISQTLKREENKLEQLETFIPKAEKYYDGMLKISYLELLKVDYEINKLSLMIKNQQDDILALNEEYEALLLQKRNLDSDKENVQREIIKLQESDEYRALKEKEDRLKLTKDKLKETKASISKFQSLLQQEMKIIKDLELNVHLDKTFKARDYLKFKLDLSSYINELQIINQNLYRSEADLDIQIRDKTIRLKTLNEEKENLQKGIENYPKDVILLKDLANNAIKEAFPNDKEYYIRPLCEYLEVKDEMWRDALEGYLNTQKFNLIIAPKYFKVVAKAYERFKEEKRIYGCGIVDYNGITVPTSVKNPLSDKLEHIDNQYARAYALSILNQVACVDKVEDVTNNKISITKTVMIYKNGVLRAARPETYKKPFIGKSSREKRIKLIEDEIAMLTSEIKDLTSQKSIVVEKLTLISESNSKTLYSMENLWLIEDTLEKTIQTLEVEIKEDKKSKGLLSVTNKLERARLKLINLEDELNKNYTATTNNRQRLGSTVQSIEMAEFKLSELEDKRLIAYDAIIDHTKFDSYRLSFLYNNRLNGELIYKTLETLKKSNSQFTGLLITKMTEYTNNFNHNLQPTIESIVDYINEYHILKNRQVVDYKEKANIAYENAKKSFEEDFIAKLSSNISDAKDMLKSINSNLKKHPFGTDQEVYEFTYSASGDYEFSKYYKIINDKKDSMSGGLFSDSLTEAEKQIMKDLFDKIAQETDSNLKERELQRYLDYRNYMSYDIKITNKNNEVIYFSKINKEKSGGETQTPFYIVMAACFDQLLSDKDESTAVVVFDEAFNNMDESRTKSLLEFYDGLNIQIIIVVPSLRMHTIANYMQTVLGVYKINNSAHIVKYEKINDSKK